MSLRATSIDIYPLKDFQLRISTRYGPEKVLVLAFPLGAGRTYPTLFCPSHCVIEAGIRTNAALYLYVHVAFRYSEKRNHVLTGMAIPIRHLCHPNLIARFASTL